mmetsp:Transcript_1930/g.2739  ORF Transcript_1930/g.2739 Transcript_1930/m.2739 type:complete len:100 (-) Transcript_1930:1147-1446(-)
MSSRSLQRNHQDEETRAAVSTGYPLSHQHSEGNTLTHDQLSSHSLQWNHHNKETHSAASTGYPTFHSSNNHLIELMHTNKNKRKQRTLLFHPFSTIILC